MLEYILNFYSEYTIIFYGLLVISVIVEWPIVILALSLVAPKLGIWFFEILFFAFLWDFFGDIILYFFGRFFSKKDLKLIKKIDKKLKNYSLLDKLIIIKYTPPLTFAWFVYLWYKKIKFKTFLKNIFVLSSLSAFFISIIWYNFWYLFKNNNNFVLFISLVFISFVIFYFIFRKITKYILKKIYEKKS